MSDFVERRQPHPPICTALVLSALFSIHTASGATFHVEPIAADVYAVVSDDPFGLANHANSVFIVGDDDVIVVDTQFTLQRSREVLQAVMRETGNKPVSTLINTHWHDDHTFGNQVYRDAFPGIEIIAHVNTRTDMATTGVQNRAAQLAGAAGALETFRGALAKHTSLAGTDLSESEALAYASTIGIIEEYLHDADTFVLTLPTASFDSQVTLMQGQRTIEIRHPGRGVTRGDLLVYLPQEQILIAGDLVANPLPFAYGADVRGWMTALSSMLDLHARVIVPGHGQVMRDDRQLRLLLDLLAKIDGHTSAAASRGESLELVWEQLDVSEFRDALTGGNEMLNFLFDEFLVRPAISSAFDLLTGNR